LPEGIEKTECQLSKVPKISVIVPTFNNERYLPQCLDSALAQTRGDFEVICVNDGSTDGSLAVMEEYCARDARFKVIDKANGGYGHTMNRGLEAAQGEYIAILESDDFILPTMFEELYGLAVEHDLDFVKADFETFQGDGTAREAVYKPICPRPSLYNKLLDPHEAFETFDVDMCTWTGIYKRAFIEEHAIRYHESPGAAFQDNGFWFQTFAFATRVMFVPRPFYQYRQDNPGSSINSTSKVFCMCDEHVWMHGFLNSHPELPHRLYNMWSKKMFHNYNFTYERIASAYKVPFLQRYAQDFLEAIKRGEVDKGDFYDDEWTAITGIIEDPVRFSKKHKDTIMGEETGLGRGRRRLLFYLREEGIAPTIRRAVGRLLRSGGST
jgi:glycosyltransferase involved in cell wall biosynthesis